MRIFLLILALFLSACGKEAPKANVNIGSIAPTFQTFRADGGAEHFPAAYFGKPLVIRFWADWCKYCEGEMKAIETVYQANKGKLQVLAINAGQDKATINAFIKKIGVTYPALLDENSAIARSYGVVGLPTTFFIDSKGIVRGKIVGEADEATFARHVQELLQ
ncbi:TlpA family protein disulfide reductase [Ferribacterium limneticum]|uniref:TlpA family protein disulfide reductase n=1 Tax=Ferribacterium limneticum TaxID=76259 RepID=UPI001CF855C0|nr:TlpA disulfide reductase family protein [Ferribacterium limneticum]UCV26875.1 TlpA family protein disulfide reductase [Ferribacterium limneticum]UCV30792.1 TlpA family protein disulfide reductase [Ferribacterium limneticum]